MLTISLVSIIPFYIQTPLQHWLCIEILNAAFWWNLDKIWLRPPFDQSHASASQLSHFNFCFNPSFQSVAGLLFRLTSGRGNFFNKERCCVCNTHFVLAQELTRFHTAKEVFFPFLIRLLIEGLSSDRVIPHGYDLYSEWPRTRYHFIKSTSGWSLFRQKQHTYFYLTQRGHITSVVKLTLAIRKNRFGVILSPATKRVDV